MPSCTLRVKKALRTLNIKTFLRTQGSSQKTAFKINLLPFEVCMCPDNKKQSTLKINYKQGGWRQESTAEKLP